MSTVSKFKNEYPFDLPAGYREGTATPSFTARRRSIAQWISDAFNRAVLFTMYTGMVLALIAFWVLILMGVASFVMSVIGGAA